MKIIPSIPKRKLIWNWRTGTLAGYTHESPPHLAGTGKQSNVVVEGAISRSESKYQLHALLCDLGKLPNFSKLQFSYLQNDSDNSPYSAEWWWRLNNLIHMKQLERVWNILNIPWMWATITVITGEPACFGPTLNPLAHSCQLPVQLSRDGRGCFIHFSPPCCHFASRMVCVKREENNIVSICITLSVFSFFSQKRSHIIKLVTFWRWHPLELTKLNSVFFLDITLNSHPLMKQLHFSFLKETGNTHAADFRPWVTAVMIVYWILIF